MKESSTLQACREALLWIAVNERHWFDRATVETLYRRTLYPGSRKALRAGVRLRKLLVEHGRLQEGRRKRRANQYQRPAVG